MSRQEWQGYLDELARRTASAEAMGGPDNLAKQNAKGRLNARQRIAEISDHNSFREIGALVGGEDPAGAPPLAGDGAIGGTARIEGFDVVIMAEDFTVKGGSIGHAQNGKRLRLARLAQERRLPYIILLDGAGERAGNAASRYPYGPNDLQLVADLQGVVPVITLILGVSAGHGALTGMFADFIVMSEGAHLFTSGPPIVKGSLGLDISADDLGSAKMHSRVSGIVHNRTESEADAFAITRRYLKTLLRPYEEHSSGAAYEIDDILDIVPANLSSSYDMSRVIARVSDSDSVLPLQPDWGRSMITSLARIGGYSCLIVANQPAVMAGSVDRDGATKACHFLEVARQFQLPVVFLADNPGVMIGPDAEKAGTLKAAAQMYGAQRKLQGTKIHVTLRKAFGFGSSIMGANPFDYQTATLAFPNISLGAMPAAGGASAAGATKEEQGRIQAAQSGAWQPADNGVFDRVIDPRQLRNELISVLGSG